MKTMLVCFVRYGDLVDQWITFNEPIVSVEFGYFYDAHYPHKVDAERQLLMAYLTHNWPAAGLLRLAMNFSVIPRLGLLKT